MAREELTVADLIRELEKYDPNSAVEVATDCCGCSGQVSRVAYYDDINEVWIYG